MSTSTVSARPSVVPQALAGTPRLLTAPATGLTEFAQSYGRLPRFADADQLIGLVADSGLTGRGGAGFPSWRKLVTVAEGNRPVVIGNGAEGEPASSKDRTLLTRHPHLVLDGLQLAASAVGAARVYLYLPEDLHPGLRTALRQRARSRWDRFPVKLVASADMFVSGQESAVVAAVSGGPGLPIDTPRRVVHSGVRGAPTLVQNVETLAHLALIARYGPEWFRQAGTAAEPGTFLATVSGAVAAPGVYEAGYGVSLGELVAMAGGLTEPAQAVLIGGYHGGWAPADPQLPISRAGLRPLGLSPGAGVLAVLPASQDGLTVSARIATYLAEQSAGQCGPCLNGLPRMAEVLTTLARTRATSGAAGRPYRSMLAEVERMAGLSTGRGACHHPDGSVRFVRSSLRMFVQEGHHATH